MLDKLRLQIKEEQASNDRERRENEGDDAKLAERTEELQEEMNCLQKTLQMKAFEEERQAELLIKSEQQVKDKDLFNKMQDNLHNQYSKERSQLKRR
jgi:Skp family chaperone for outer membrane proteins